MHFGGQSESRSSAQRLLFEGFVVAVLTSIIPLIGALTGAMLLDRNGAGDDLVHRFLRFDGARYLRIAESGYSYHPESASDVAFFPAYPIASRCIGFLLQIPLAYALLIVSHISFLISVALFSVYHDRYHASVAIQSRAFALASLSLIPCSFFLRMGYSESLFLLLALLVLFELRNATSLWRVTLLVGLATAIRPVGIALVPCVWLFLYKGAGPLRPYIVRCVIWTPLAMWGIVCYCIALWWVFDEPFAMAATQDHWRIRADTGIWTKALALCSLEPIWGVYCHWSPAYWMYHNPPFNPILSLTFANPLYFVGTFSLVVIGWSKGWLDKYETVLSVGLLLIPYLTRAYEMGMASHGRFALVVFPVYVVIGRLLTQFSLATSVALLALSAALMGMYAAFFAAGYVLI
jgi:hypothetical protein